MLKKIVWVGMSENKINGEISNTEFDLKQVVIPEKLNHKYYGGFCNDLLWPLFHYFPTIANFDEDYFEAYTKANELFFEELEKEIKPGDYIWVHDYQLFLLPDMIRKKFPNATVGFFLHIPFPSFEMFRLIPGNWRAAILKGILGADLVGFHTNDYSQNFIRSVKRTLGYECKQNIINYVDRIAKVDAFPIGIDYDKFHDACNTKKVLYKKAELRKGIIYNKLVFSIDRLDYSKGFLYRLAGYELFLEKHPEWHQKVIFNMVIIPSRVSIVKYQEMKKEIEATVGRINGKFGNLSWIPIIYQYKSLSFSELIALYDLSDVGLITPLRDGMNLVAKEYIACQVENIGVLILSELAGAAAELSEAILIIPTDKHQIADSINKALEMTQDEKTIKLLRMQKRIKSYDVFSWANDFFSQTIQIKKEQEKMKVKYIDWNIQQKLINGYANSDKRIIFIDYDGTLVPFSKYPENAIIDNNTLDIIRKLTVDKKNDIVIISGREKDFLEKQMNTLNVRIVAEHGYFIRDANKNWRNEKEIDLKWKDFVKPLFENYVERCAGTFIEEKSASLAWHYRNAEIDFASLRLSEFKDDLMEILKNMENLTILEGNKVLEVKSMGYDKGTAAMKIIEKSDYNFILAIGDDKTDELLFEALPKNSITIKIGTEPTLSNYNFKRQSELIEFLTLMTQ